MTLEQARLQDLIVRSFDAAWTYERWLTLPDDGQRYEVIDGVLYMTTAPRFFHQWIIRNIVRELWRQIDDHGIGITTWAPIGLLMPGCTPVQPDILVIRTEDRDIIYDGRIHGVPALIVEVLSSGNTATDLHIKRAAYARAGLPEYWIVRPLERAVLVLTQPAQEGGDYLQAHTIAADAVLHSASLPFSASISAFFAGSPDETI